MTLSVGSITRPREIRIILATVAILVTACEGCGATNQTSVKDSAASLLKPTYGSFALNTPQKTADGTSVPSNHRSSVLAELRDDISYLVGEPDFCAVVGALAICPRVFDSAFKNESPEFTEMWGTSYFADQFFEFGEGLGSAAFPLSASVICYSIGKVRHRSTAESFGRDLLRAQAINGLLTLSLKGFINRTRPDGTQYSYPSGHTSTAFTSAGVIHHHFGTTWGLPAYVIATYVGFSRLQENKHYLSDVIAGAVLGSYVAYKVTHKRGKGSNRSILPFSAGKTFGARLAISF
jgi:hypothetical protein